MYFYIYDTFTSKPQYAKKLNQISLKLTDLGIFHEKAKASPLRPIETLVREALADKKCRNIIAVGDDQTANQIINILASAEKKITFGIIPLRRSKIAEALGIPEGEPACQEISARKLKQVDLGKINGRYFLTSIEVKPQREKIKSLFQKFFLQSLPLIKLNFENQFTLSTKIENLLFINIPSFSNFKKISNRKDIQKKINPKDGLLDIMIWSKQKSFFLKDQRLKFSFLQAKRVKLDCQNSIEIQADSQPIKKLPCDISISTRQLEVIVGKKRVFS